MRTSIWIAVLALAAAGCSAPQQPTHARKPAKPKRDAMLVPQEDETAIKYVEECMANFRDAPSTNQQQPAIAAALTEEADTLAKLASSLPTTQDIVVATVDAINKYRYALTRDPFNPHITLKLAVAYDMAFRKGCALSLLKRLGVLDEDPRYHEVTTRLLDEVSDNTALFKGYRKDAMAAMGR